MQRGRGGFHVGKTLISHARYLYSNSILDLADCGVAQKNATHSQLSLVNIIDAGVQEVEDTVDTQTRAAQHSNGPSEKQYCTLKNIHKIQEYYNHSRPPKQGHTRTQTERRSYQDTWSCKELTRCSAVRKSSPMPTVWVSNCTGDAGRRVPVKNGILLYSVMDSGGATDNQKHSCQKIVSICANEPTATTFCLLKLRARVNVHSAVLNRVFKSGMQRSPK